MRKITGTCSEVELLPSEGQGHALAVVLTSTGDEPVPVSGVFLARKGINAFPEFAEGFGFDTSNILEGEPPERYQFRVEMLVAHAGRIMYGDGKSEFQLGPGKSVRFVMPLPFQGYDYFTGAPPEDLFIAVANLNDEDLTVDVPDLHAVITRSIDTHGYLGRPYNIHVSILVPSKAPPDQSMANMVGRTNEKAIRARRDS